jgi:hypothetical protein
LKVKALRLFSDRVRFLFLAALFVIVIAGGFAVDGQAPAGVGAPERDAQESVMLARMAGSTLDEVDRVEFALGDDDAHVRDVWFSRRPHVLSDGVQVLQTPSFQSEVFVRQVIEHPLATKTVVVFPGFSAQPGNVASRFLSMVDIAALNTGRELQVLAAGPDGDLERYHSFGPTPVLPSVSDAMDALADHTMAAHLYSAFESMIGQPIVHSMLGGSDAGVAAQSAGLAGEDGTTGVTRSDVERLILERNATLLALLDGQGLLVVERIERAIRAKVAVSPDIDNDEIANLNTLQIELAVVLGQSELWATIFEERSSAVTDAESTLREIDRLTGTNTLSIFRQGLASIRHLFLESIPAALRSLVEPPAVEPEPEIPGAVYDASREAILALVNAAPAGSFTIVEAGTESLYDLIRSSFEQSSFNVIVMSDTPVGAPADVAATQAVSVAALLAAVSVETGAARDRSPHEQLNLDRLCAVEKLRVAVAIGDMEPDTAIVTRRQVEEGATIIGLAIREGSDDPRVDFYLIPAVAPQEFSAAIADLGSGQSTIHLDSIQGSILTRWALVARTAVDL